MSKMFYDKRNVPGIITDHISVIQKNASENATVCYLGIIGDKVYVFTKDKIIKPR